MQNMLVFNMVYDTCYAVCHTYISEECLDDEFRCTNGECIHLEKVCDHKVDCTLDGDDEFCGIRITLLTSFAVLHIFQLHFV